MLKAKIVIFLSAYFWCTSIFSQETILLKGKITADSLDGSSIHIINLTRQTGTTNSVSGDFEIQVAVNDILKFSSVQYDIVEVKISEEIFERKYLQVELLLDLNELGEVLISNINLTGNLEQDLQKMEVFNQADVGFPFSNKPAQSLMARKFNSSTNSPLILLINTLNGRIKMLKKAKENFKFDAKVDKGIEIVTTEFFVEELGIPEEEILNFVYFCAESPGFSEIITAGKHLDLLANYYKNAPIFLKQLKEKIRD
ncbi:hypothetical protein [Gillisia limnaea]|uniref:Uncharacterized protein n=1 Tax=Gillisia limnaea (strain DSM 15749 / LMG 21470 / R-8282) TaxID=865937 RepID=H2BYG3_GILLR|nr:hypothetical protein [Gillisia limnaea]EHQ03302.1 hypothetical protein Gilli_2687 [Gillisia limnaea DSM 15749]